MKCSFRFFYLVVLCVLLVQTHRVRAQSELRNFTTGYLIDASTAIAPDGTVYVPCYENIYAMTPGGSNKWIFPPLSTTTVFPGIFGSPSIGTNGTIYFGGADDGILYALDPATGTNKWTYSIFGNGVFYTSPAIGPDGAIYIGSYKVQNNDTPYLYCINTNGTLRWRYAPAGGSIYSSAAISQDGGTIYFGCDDGKLYAISTNGTLRWTCSTGNKAITAAPAIGADGKIYIGVGSVLIPKFYCVNTNGTTNWVFTCTNRIQSSAAIGDDGTIYFGSDDMHLYALNPNGTLKWAAFTGATNASSPALAADGTIYLGSDNGKLYAYNSSGSNLWWFTTGGVIFSSPAIGTNGTVYIGSEDGKIYALSGTSGLARAPWPMLGHDLRHTAKYVAITNTPPSISALGNQTNNANTTLGPLAFTVSDAETPAGNLLVSGVSSNTILVPNAALLFSGTGSNRFLTLTPATNQSGTTRITVTVTDAAGATNSTSFLFTVIAGNQAPQFVSTPNRTNDEMTLIMFTIVATDADSPPQTLTYSLLAAPTNATINPATGVFTWTPTEAQGPCTSNLVVSVTDNGTPPLSATQNFFITVREVNLPPVRSPITNLMVHQGTPVSFYFSATDPDLPTNNLAFSLTNAPAGAGVNPGTGLFNWTPATNQVNTTNVIGAGVTDNGVPPLGVTNAFTIVVLPPPQLQSLISLTDGFVIAWNSIPQISYRVQYKTNLNDSVWTDLAGDVFATGYTAAKTNAPLDGLRRFYRVRVLP